MAESETPTTLPISGKQRVLPVVRSLEEAGPMLVDGALARVVGPDILVLFVQDFDNAFAYLGTAYLESIEEGPDELLDLALENLGRRNIEVHGDGAIKMVTCGGYYEAALIFRPELWLEQVGLDDPAHAAVLIAAHDVLMVCDVRKPVGLARLWEIGEEIASEQVEHPVSRQVWLLGDELEVAPRPSADELDAIWTAVDPSKPLWRTYLVTAVVAFAYALGGGQVIGEFVQSNGLDTVLSWQAIAGLFTVPWLVALLVDALGGSFMAQSTSVRISGAGWLYATVLFLVTLGMCVFAIDAMPRTYVLTGAGAVACATMASMHFRAARTLAREHGW